MISTEKKGLIELVKIALPYFLYSLLYALLVISVEEYYGDHLYTDSTQIGSVFGLAVAFFLGFRMNSAYDRWWEARKIFGELTTNSRSFVAKLYTYLNNPKNTVDLDGQDRIKLIGDLIDLNGAYVLQLKNEIHEIPHPNYDSETTSLFKKYNIDTKNKVSNEILLSLSSQLETHFSRESNIEKNDLMQHINRFYDIQGKAERINNTPFLKIYSAFTRVIVMVYVLLIPIFIGDIDIGGENNPLEMISIPILAVISTVFLTINKLANLYGDPLEENNTSIPIDQICQTIIANCKEVKGKLESRQ